MRPEELAQRLSGGAFAEAKTRILTAAGQIELRHAQARTPVRTGALRRSESFRVAGDRVSLTAGVVYAPFVHKRIPFFTLGIQDAQAEVERMMKTEIERFLDEVAG